MLLLPALSTEQVPQKPLDVTAPQGGVEVPRLAGRGLALIIRGYEEPIFAEGPAIVLGRYDPGSSYPTVDLTPFNAGALGVSRMHARIHCQNDVYLIEDLNSTNGTWVNQQRLPADKKQGLANGDVIQLGQLVMRVYFDAATALRSVEERISFRNVGAKLTPQYLATRITPYLTALAEVQEICDVFLGRTPATIEIQSIGLDGPDLITVRLSGAREALKLVKGPLKTWRQTYASRISRFLELKTAIESRTSLLMEQGEVAAAPPNEDAARQLGRELREAEVKLAFEFLRQLAPDDPGDDYKSHVDKLIKPLHLLAFSPLHVTTTSKSMQN